MKKPDYKFDYEAQQFKRCPPNKTEKRLATLLIFIIFAVVAGLALLVFTNKAQGQKQQKKKQTKITSVIDSTKFIRYYVLNGDTIKHDTLSKSEKQHIRMDLLIKKKKK